VEGRRQDRSCPGCLLENVELLASVSSDVLAALVLVFGSWNGLWGCSGWCGVGTLLGPEGTREFVGVVSPGWLGHQTSMRSGSGVWSVVAVGWSRVVV